MPELPEVETVVRGLRPALEGRRIARLELRRPDLRFPFPADFAAKVEGRIVTQVVRRAKYALLRLDDGAAILMHLGMSGRVTVGEPGANAPLGVYLREAPRGPDPKHDHVIVHMEGGGGFVFNDPRRFGFFDHVPMGGETANKFLAGLGPEPLSEAFDAAYLRARLKGARTSVKAALLDQRVVAGLGNIYVCEALFHAKTSPRRLAKNAGPTRAGALVLAVKDVLVRAIAAGGSSLRDFAAVDGSLGYFPHDFQVYGREGEACRVCGARISRLVQAGRSTFHCGACQR